MESFRGRIKNRLFGDGGKQSMERQTGCVHIYCGDGKGKTTCGMGLCVRAAGYGYRILIYQFMKDNSTSERKAMEKIPGITFVPGLKQEKFSFQMTDQEKEDRKHFYEEKFREVVKKAQEENYDGLFDEELLIRWLREKPEHLEVILTGQDPGEELTACADYVSELKKIRHPFDRGLAARDGIEK